MDGSHHESGMGVLVRALLFWMMPAGVSVKVNVRRSVVRVLVKVQVRLCRPPKAPDTNSNQKNAHEPFGSVGEHFGRKKLAE